MGSWRWMSWGLGLIAAATSARAETIAEVLERSQAQRLERLASPERGEPSPEAVQRIQLSFDRLVAHLRLEQPIGLKVVRSDALAETLHGRLVVVDERLAALPEGQRLFVLAHEIGHVALSHWAALGQVYQRHIPDEVIRSKTDAVAAVLGREASALAHAHEYAADAYGLAVLRALGHGEEDVQGVFARFGPSRDTPTHPGTRRRLARLLSQERLAMQE